MSSTQTETKVRLNLGAGQYKTLGWTSVDIVPEFEPDIIEDVCTLPSFEPGTVDSLYIGHLYEHVDQPIAALHRWFEVLKPGGDICITMPDHRKSVELWLNAERFPVLTDNPLVGLLAVSTGFYGWNQYRQMKEANPLAALGQVHKRSLDPPILMALMQFAGFVELEQIDETQHEAAPKFAERVSWQQVIRGFKPLAGSDAGSSPSWDGLL